MKFRYFWFKWKLSVSFKIPSHYFIIIKVVHDDCWVYWNRWDDWETLNLRRRAGLTIFNKFMKLNCIEFTSATSSVINVDTTWFSLIEVRSMSSTISCNQIQIICDAHCASLMRRFWWERAEDLRDHVRMCVYRIEMCVCVNEVCI